MEYKTHTAMAPQDAKEAIEKYKKKRKEKDLWYLICLFILIIYFNRRYSKFV